jgi:outer membrane protein assembly factor BamB
MQRALIALIVLISALPVSGLDWPRWRGPDASGVSAETGIRPAALSSLKVLWKAALGNGYSSPSIANGFVYGMGNRGGMDTVTCLSAETGKVAWTFSYDCGAGSYPGPKATPTVDGGMVYTLSRDGQLYALNAATGAVRWSHVMEEYGLQAPDFDFAGPPVVVGNLLLINAGTSGLALDKATGAKAWVSGSGPGGYAAPVLATIGGSLTAVLFGQRDVFGVDPKTGTVRWQFPWETGSDVNAADPVVIGNAVFISTAYGKGCALWDVSGAKPSAVWQNHSLETHFSGFVAMDGFLYGIDGDSRQPSSGSLRCVSLKTGAVAWSAPLGFGSLVATRTTLYVLTASGTLIAADLSPKGFTERARAVLPRDQYWTPPAIANGVMYVRGLRGELTAIDMK